MLWFLQNSFVTCSIEVNVDHLNFSSINKLDTFLKENKERDKSRKVVRGFPFLWWNTAPLEDAGFFLNIYSLFIFPLLCYQPIVFLFTIVLSQHCLSSHYCAITTLFIFPLLCYGTIFYLLYYWQFLRYLLLCIQTIFTLGLLLCHQVVVYLLTVVELYQNTFSIKSVLHFDIIQQ